MWIWEAWECCSWLFIIVWCSLQQIAEKEGPEEGLPVPISQPKFWICPRAQIPSSHCLFCSNHNPIFYCSIAGEPQSQCMKSHFQPKISKSQFPFYSFRTKILNIPCPLVKSEDLGTRLIFVPGTDTYEINCNKQRTLNLEIDFLYDSNNRYFVQFLDHWYEYPCVQSWPTKSIVIFSRKSG
jgi:hypothetical protein